LANGSITYTLPNSTTATTLPAYPANVSSTGYYNTDNGVYYVTTNNSIGSPLDTGTPAIPGSLGGSQYQKLIPVNLNPYYTSGILLPATYSVSEAIEQVVTCNCDCWVH
jgi:hypothetical protein